MIDPSNPYTDMQRRFYEADAPVMDVEDHSVHNDNPDYWEILVKDTETGFEDMVGLDFACGTGRNVVNLASRFRHMFGCDISGNNCAFAKKRCEEQGLNNVGFWQTSGVDLHLPQGGKTFGQGIQKMGWPPGGIFDFVMSTIAFQHIPVHEIRLALMRDIHRVLKPGGMFSFQMGYGQFSLAHVDGYGLAEYHDNAYDAVRTNSGHDVKVTSWEQLRKDLMDDIGFTVAAHHIRPAWSDHHPQWIFVKAIK